MLDLRHSKITSQHENEGMSDFSTKEYKNRQKIIYFCKQSYTIVQLELALIVKISFSKFSKRICKNNTSNKNVPKFFVTYEYLPCPRSYYRSLKLFYRYQNTCNLLFDCVFSDLPTFDRRTNISIKNKGPTNHKILRQR